jgi:hypothetical protein
VKRWVVGIVRGGFWLVGEVDLDFLGTVEELVRELEELVGEAVVVDRRWVEE